MQLAFLAVQRVLQGLLGSLRGSAAQQTAVVAAEEAAGNGAGESALRRHGPRCPCRYYLSNCPPSLVAAAALQDDPRVKRPLPRLPSRLSQQQEQQQQADLALPEPAAAVPSSEQASRQHGGSVPPVSAPGLRPVHGRSPTQWQAPAVTESAEAPLPPFEPLGRFALSCLAPTDCRWFSVFSPLQEQAQGAAATGAAASASHPFPWYRLAAGAAAIGAGLAVVAWVSSNTEIKQVPRAGSGAGSSAASGAATPAKGTRPEGAARASGQGAEAATQGAATSKPGALSEALPFHSLSCAVLFAHPVILIVGAFPFLGAFFCFVSFCFFPKAGRASLAETPSTAAAGAGRAAGTAAASAGAGATTTHVVSLDSREAERIIRHWQEVKSAALGARHQVERLAEVLEGERGGRRGVASWGEEEGQGGAARITRPQKDPGTWPAPIASLDWRITPRGGGAGPVALLSAFAPAPGGSWQQLAGFYELSLCPAPPLCLALQLPDEST